MSEQEKISKYGRSIRLRSKFDDQISFSGS